MSGYGSFRSAGIGLAENVVRLSDFHPAGAPTEARGAATPGPHSFSRRPAHAISSSLRWANVHWRNLAAHFLPGVLFLGDATTKVRAVSSPNVGSAGPSATHRGCSEQAAQHLTLGPRLPHHRRHPKTADEACAGLILIVIVAVALGLLAWTCFL